LSGLAANSSYDLIVAKKITMSFAHELGQAEVKRRLENAIADARSEFPDALKGAQGSWPTDNRMEFHAVAMGQAITGFVDIQPRVVHVSVDLPFMLSLFAGKLRPRIEQEAQRLLAK